MTNEEAYNIISEFCFTGYEDNKKPSFKLFGAIHELILDVEENTKLKAEIEELAKHINNITIENTNLLIEQYRLERLIEQLKSELEQSIKLPCNVGDIVYLVDYEEKCIDESVVIDIVYHLASEELEFETEHLYFYSEDLEDDYIFFTREEAKQSLKGEKNESKTNQPIS